MHIAIVLMKCSSSVCDSYFGNSSLSVKDRRNLEQILKTFISDRKIQNPNSLANSEKIRKKRNHAKGTGRISLTEGEILGKKSRLFFDEPGPFLTKEESLKAAPSNN